MIDETVVGRLVISFFLHQREKERHWSLGRLFLFIVFVLIDNDRHELDVTDIGEMS